MRVQQVGHNIDGIPPVKHLQGRKIKQVAKHRSKKEQRVQGQILQSCVALCL